MGEVLVTFVLERRMENQLLLSEERVDEYIYIVLYDVICLSVNECVLDDRIDVELL